MASGVAHSLEIHKQRQNRPDKNVAPYFSCFGRDNTGQMVNQNAQWQPVIHWPLDSIVFVEILPDDRFCKTMAGRQSGRHNVIVTGIQRGLGIDKMREPCQNYGSEQKQRNGSGFCYPEIVYDRRFFAAHCQNLRLSSLVQPVFRPSL